MTVSNLEAVNDPTVTRVEVGRVPPVGTVADFRWRALQCRTNLDAYDAKAAGVWGLAADALADRPSDPIADLAPEMLRALQKMYSILRQLQPALNVMAREVLEDVINDQIEPVLRKAGHPV